MEKEKIDVLDENGKETGKVVFKSDAHKQGIWHRGVHIWIYNSKGEVLLQKRAKMKKFYPDLWDMSAAGHVSAGQSFDEAVERELFEELGVKAEISEMKKFGVRKMAQDLEMPFLRNREFVQTYLLKLDKEISDFKLQEEEVAEVKFVTLDDFESEIKSPANYKTYVPHKEYFLHMIELIREELR